ncbi:MAG: alpha/beta hydrolase-fold protein [Anaerolineales bacterium]|nr:alpha/beta hydrolase-fold protein [Anaerolineales bacterium]
MTPGSTGQTGFPACEEASGRVERTEYSSQLLGEYIPVLVYLPPCYPDRGEYPVLFLLHGKPQDEKHWTILGVDQFVDERIQTGELAELVLVMPQQPEPLFSQTDGGPGSYEGEFLSALVPVIESRYAISTRPEARSIAGISRGGVWALEIAFTHPEAFDGVGGLSPALEVNDARLAYDPIELAASKDELPEHIFLASGDVDSSAAETQRLHAVLTERGAAHRYTTVPGGHEGATWEQLIGEMLVYLTSHW